MFFTRHRAWRPSRPFRGRLLDRGHLTETATAGHPDSRPKPRNMAIFCRQSSASRAYLNILLNATHLHRYLHIQVSQSHAFRTASSCSLPSDGAALPPDRPLPGLVDNLTDSLSRDTAFEHISEESRRTLRPQVFLGNRAFRLRSVSPLDFACQRSAPFAPKAGHLGGTSTNRLAGHQHRRHTENKAVRSL